MSGSLSFKGCSSFRHRIICATLSGKSIRISDIRADEGGLRDFEASFLRLIDKLSNGSHIEINDTGTKLRLEFRSLHQSLQLLSDLILPVLPPI